MSTPTTPPEPPVPDDGLQRSLLASIVESSDDAILSETLDGVITSWNQAAERLYGYRAEEVIGRTAEILLHPDHPDELKHILGRIRAGERVKHYETDRVRKDGSILTVSLTVSPIHDRGANVVGASSIARDITERRRMDERSRASAEYARSILEAAPDAMVIAGRDGKILFVNTQTERFFQYKVHELLGRPVELLLPERLRSQHPAYREAYHHAPRVRPMGSGLLLYARRRDGTEFPVEISLSPLDTPEGQIVLAAIRDVTERAEAESAKARAAAELARSNAELEQFAYVASHDLQEPLRMVSAYVQLLEKRYKGQLDAQADKYIHYAVDGAHRMEALIAALLEYSRAGRADLEFARVDTAVVFDRVLSTLEALISSTGALITRGPLPTVRYNEAQFVRVLQNLLTNALKFRRPDETPRVHVAATRREGEWVFSVHDNGIGIEAAYADRVFVIFQRLHTRAEYPGTGIGLAICKRVVERLGGRIWLESRLGEGTTFFFTLSADEDDQVTNGTDV